jgi:hypothetical protein
MIFFITVSSGEPKTTTAKIGMRSNRHGQVTHQLCGRGFLAEGAVQAGPTGAFINIDIAVAALPDATI